MKILGHTYRVFAFLLAFLMFFTSMGFSMDVHYCQDEVRNVSLLGKASSCHDISKEHNCDSDQKSCHSATATVVDSPQNHGCEGENSCCHNKHINVSQLEELSVIGTVFSAEEMKVVLPIFFPVQTIDINIESEPLRIKFLKCKPPLIDRDLQVLFQSFLI